MPLLHISHLESWWLFGLGLLVLFAAFVLFVVYRVFTTKPTVPPRSPLAQAVFDADTDKVAILLNEGVDPNSEMGVAYKIALDGEVSASFRVPIIGSSPQKSTMCVLAFAAMEGSTEIIGLLLDKGVDIDRRDEYGQTALILAAWAGDEASVKLLLDNHADIAARDQSGATALMWAEIEGHSEVAEILKKAGAEA